MLAITRGRPLTVTTIDRLDSRQWERVTVCDHGGLLDDGDHHKRSWCDAYGACAEWQAACQCLAICPAHAA